MSDREWHDRRGPKGAGAVFGESPSFRQQIARDDKYLQELFGGIEDAVRDVRRGAEATAMEKLRSIRADLQRNSSRQMSEPTLQLIQASFHVATARAHIGAGHADSGSAEFEAAARSFENVSSAAFNAMSLRDHGIALYELGRSDDASVKLELAADRGESSGDTDYYRGLIALDAGKDADAVTLLRSAVEKEPLCPWPSIALARALERSGDPNARSEAAESYRSAGIQLVETNHKEEALDAFRRSVHLDATPSGRLGVGEALRLMGKFEEAIAAVEEDDRYSLALGTRGACLVRLGRFEEALTVLDRAIEIDSEYGFGHASRAEALFNVGRMDEALKSIERAVVLEPDRALWHAIRGEVLRVLERYEEANEATDRSLAIEPTGTFALGTRGATLSALNRLDEALATLDHALELNPDYVFVHAHRGDVLRKLDRFEEALQSVDRAIELDASCGPAYTVRGQILSLMDRTADALVALDRANELNPDNAFVLGLCGDVLLRLGRFADALEALDKAVELEPTNAFAQSRRGAALRSLDRWPQALEAFDKAIERDPDNPFTLVRRADALRALHRTDEAYESAAKALEFSLSDADRALAYSIQGDVLRMREQFHDALAMLDRARELSPNNAFIRATRGEVLRMLERPDDALAELDRAISISPDYAWAIATRSELFRMKNKYRDARAGIIRAIELADGDYPWAVGLLGMIEMETGRLDAALKAYEQALSGDDDLSFAQIGKGRTLQLMCRFDEAREALRIAVERFPTDWEGKLYYAGALILAERKDEANTLLESVAAEIKDQSAPTVGDLAGLGQTETLLGRYRDAMRTLTDAMTIDPGSTYLLYDLALAAVCARRFDLGLEEYRRALRTSQERDEPERHCGLALAAQRDLEVATTVNRLVDSGKHLAEAMSLLEQAFTPQIMEAASS